MATQTQKYLNKGTTQQQQTTRVKLKGIMSQEIIKINYRIVQSIFLYKIITVYNFVLSKNSKLKILTTMKQILNIAYKTQYLN